MASAPNGALGRLAGRLRSALGLRQAVGADEMGNTYWRQVEKQPDGTELERRSVKYRGDLDPTSLPPEWSQWLHRTRPTPPTEADRARGEAQRQQQKQNAAQADAEAARQRVRQQAGSGPASAFRQQLTGAQAGTGGGSIDL